jgi:hypothetical protein
MVSRPGSIASHANSAYSNGSTRHILNDLDTPLDPPNAPFASAGLGISSSGSGNSSPTARNSGEVSLTVNYLPTKFSTSMLAGGGARKRRSGKKGDPINPVMPKRGGGVEAFRSGEARMPGEGDEDDYGGLWFGGNPGDTGPTKRKLRWNKFKWMLFLANVMVCIIIAHYCIVSNANYPVIHVQHHSSHLLFANLV